MATRSHELRLADRLRTCEQMLDQIRTEAHAGLDQWWAADLQQSLQKIQRLADLGLEGKRVYQLAGSQAPSKKQKKEKQDAQ